MRIISQDGETDYPYENSVVYVVENEIFRSCKIIDVRGEFFGT